MARAAAELGGRAEPHEGEAIHGGENMAGLATTMARAQLAVLSACLGFGRQVAEVQVRRGMRIGGPLAASLRGGALGERDRQALVEEARGYLREVSTLALDEARTLQRALAEIDRRLHTEAGDQNEHAPRRRWKAKD
jgi:hypothetical protein